MNRSKIPVYFDERQLAHEPLQELHNGGWAAYAEMSERARNILSQVHDPREVRDHGLEHILAVHEANYVEFLRTAHDEWRAAGREGDAIGYTLSLIHI